MDSKVFIQKDHTILPKATLKRFASHDTKKICYLDLSDLNRLEIKYTFPKSFHTKKNFYDPDVDKKIKYYETTMGKYVKAIEQAQINEKEIN